MHAVARRLCYFRNQDWRYDPGEPNHEHWREKARIILADLDRIASTAALGEKLP